MIEAMKQAMEVLESSRVFVTTREKIKHPEGTEWYDDRITALRLAIEQAEKQEPVINIELSRRMAAVKVNNFYGSIIKDAEKEIERLHGLVLQHTAPPQRQPLTEEEFDKIENRVYCRTREKGKPLGVYVRELCRAIERAHGIGGGE